MEKIRFVLFVPNCSHNFRHVSKYNIDLTKQRFITNKYFKNNAKNIDYDVISHIMFIGNYSVHFVF